MPTFNQIRAPSALLDLTLDHPLASLSLVGSVRLVDGNSSLEGRVEVYLPGQWGTVCSDQWSHNDASVVCRQLGYDGVVSELTPFGTGSGPILLSDVLCLGHEDRLASCLHRVWGRHDCTHDTDVGVVCSNSTASYATVPLGGMFVTGTVYQVDLQG